MYFHSFILDQNSCVKVILPKNLQDTKQKLIFKKTLLSVVQEIQLRTEGSKNADLGTLAPS
jgi:hypothetical protein